MELVGFNVKVLHLLFTYFAAGWICPTIPSPIQVPLSSAFQRAVARRCSFSWATEKGIEVPVLVPVSYHFG